MFFFFLTLGSDNFLDVFSPEPALGSWFVYNSEGSWEGARLQLAVCAELAVGGACVCPAVGWSWWCQSAATAHRELGCSPALLSCSSVRAAVPALISAVLGHGWSCAERLRCVGQVVVWILWRKGQVLNAGFNKRIIIIRTHRSYWLQIQDVKEKMLGL